MAKDKRHANALAAVQLQAPKMPRLTEASHVRLTGIVQGAVGYGVVFIDLPSDDARLKVLGLRMPSARAYEAAQLQLENAFHNVIRKPVRKGTP